MFAAKRQQDTALRAGTKHSEKLSLRLRVHVASEGPGRTPIPEFPSSQFVRRSVQKIAGHRAWRSHTQFHVREQWQDLALCATGKMPV
jgi:hypothetical protein